MNEIRTANRFGRRYVRLREFMNYASDLDIIVDMPGEGLLS